jgi:hypothetical protein
MRWCMFAPDLNDSFNTCFYFHKVALLKITRNLSKATSCP